MTRIRTLLGALAAGTLGVILATGVNAQTTNTITGTSSQVDFGCLGLLQVVSMPPSLCQYDAMRFPPGIFGGPESNGPVQIAGYYAVGNSPWDNNGAPGDVGGTVGDGKYELPLSGSITFDDKGTPCDADDTLAGTVSYGAATRNFAGGPGTQGEETWGDGDLSFTLAETVVSSATANGVGGCDYVIGSDGAPPLLTAANGAEYGDDVNIGYPFDPMGVPPVFIWEPNDGTDYTGVSPTISALEATPNVGAPLTVTNGATYLCEFFNAGVVPCTDGGSHHEVMTMDMGSGDRGAIENSIWAVSTDAIGNITSAEVYPNSENPVGGFNQPQWTSPRWQITGTCQSGCVTAGTANDDSASTLQDTSVDIDVLANDTGFNDPVTVTIDTQSVDGTATVNGSPGAQAAIDISFLPNIGFTGQTTFVYQVDDGAFIDTATVTVDVQADTLPVAPDGNLAIDTRGQEGAAAAASLNVSSLPGYATGNGTPICTISANATNGIAVCAGTTVTYTPKNGFVNESVAPPFTKPLFGV